MCTIPKGSDRRHDDEMPRNFDERLKYLRSLEEKADSDLIYRVTRKLTDELC